MRQRLTVVHLRAGSAVDLELECATGTSFADLSRALTSTATGSAPCISGYWEADGLTVHDDLPVGLPPLLEGTTLTHHCGVEVAPPLAATPRGVLELQVVEGPDCGASRTLRVGNHRIGRGAGADLRVNDPDLSRLHCEVRVEHDRVLLRDLGSSNGSCLDGRDVGSTSVEWTTGQRLRVGGSTLQLRLPTEPRAAVTTDGEGHLQLNPAPGPQQRHPDVVIRMPRPPDVHEAGRLPVLMVLLPLLACTALAVVMRNAAMLVFGLLGPVMFLSSWLSDRRGGRLSASRRREDHARALDRCRERVEDAVRDERRRLRSEAPDLADMLGSAGRPGVGVWKRRPGQPWFGVVRLGTGDVPAATTVVPADPERSEEHPLLVDAPVTLSLSEHGPLGIAGPREVSLRCARGLVGQLCAQHSPRDLTVMVLAADQARLRSWDWASWLPHTRDYSVTHGRNAFGALDRGHQVQDRLAELDAVARERRTARDRPGGQAPCAPAVLVVLDGAHQLRSVPGLAALLEEGRSLGLLLVVLDEEVQRLPVETRSLLRLAADGRSAQLRLSAGSGVLDFRPDLVGAGWAERLGRSLARLRDATPRAVGAEPPDLARLLDLLGWDGTDPAEVADRWATLGGTTVIPIGLGGEGIQRIDLCRDGPHALIGGTTGSGKSELLQNLIAALALGNRPDEVSFVLVDYKGGSAFKDCARLPHAVGLVTDLDEHLAERALVSLQAELKRRESLLGLLGVKDIEDYHRLRQREDPPLPRLVLVIDEFRVLADEHPGFLDGLVRIAAVGRSLGVHLVLATQRPGGIVSGDIKANVNLRIALRVRDSVDSQDVVDSPRASMISERHPGRAVMRTGAGSLRTFQSARVGGRAPSAVATVRLEALTTNLLGEPRPPEEVPTVGDEETDLTLIVSAARAACSRLAIAPVRAPWLPPLPPVLTLPEAAPTSPSLIPYAVLDLPRQQRQDPLSWDLATDGHLALVGAPRTGRTTGARTLAASLARRMSPADAHLHVFDAGAGLAALTSLPHVGTVIGRDETVRGCRLLTRLLEEVAERRRLLADLGLGSIEEQRAVAREVGRSTAWPYLVVLVDGWEIFVQTYEEVDHGAPVDQLLQVLREGHGVGVRGVLTGDRSLLGVRVSGVLRHKLCLRPSDETDLLLAGVPRTALPVQMPPGRAVRVEDGAELQIALLDRGPSSTAQLAALERIAAEARSRHRAVPRERRPFRVEPLPRHVALAAVQLEVKGQGVARDAAAAAGWVPLGVGGDDLRPVGLAAPPDGVGLLVAGPRGSGRSTALLTIVAGLTGAGRSVVVVADRHSPLSRLCPRPAPGAAGESATAPAGEAPGSPIGPDQDQCVVAVHAPLDAGALAQTVQAHPGALLVVDDVEQVLDGPSEPLLLAALRRGRTTGAGVVCAGTTAELANVYRGLVAELRSRATGLLLTPASPRDGDVLGIRVAPLPEAPPGRALLVTRGRAQVIQVAHTPPPAAP